MIVLVTVVCAGFLFLVPLGMTGIPMVTVAGIVAVALAAAGIVAPWRWPSTAAACVFATNYALALWVAQPPISVVAAAAVGVALLGLVQSAEVARLLRHTTVSARVVRSQLLGWLVFGALTVGTAMLVLVLARRVAGAIPFAAAPVVAALGALGVVLGLAGALTAGRRPGR